MLAWALSLTAWVGIPALAFGVRPGDPFGWSMLPMMCAMPWLASWCRGSATAPSIELAWHYLSMFAPALLGARLGWHRCVLPVMALAGAGAGLYFVLLPASGWVLLVLCQGAAWAVAQQAGSAAAPPSGS
ncbi:MAG: hypothetical protein AB7G13_28910 [Lautropia sp.]